MAAGELGNSKKSSEEEILNLDALRRGEATRGDVRSGETLTAFDAFLKRLPPSFVDRKPLGENMVGRLNSKHKRM